MSTSEPVDEMATTSTWTRRRRAALATGLAVALTASFAAGADAAKKQSINPLGPTGHTVGTGFDCMVNQVEFQKCSKPTRTAGENAADCVVATQSPACTNTGPAPSAPPAEVPPTGDPGVDTVAGDPCSVWATSALIQPGGSESCAPEDCAADPTPCVLPGTPTRGPGRSCRASAVRIAVAALPGQLGRIEPMVANPRFTNCRTHYVGNGIQGLEIPNSDPTQGSVYVQKAHAETFASGAGISHIGGVYIDLMRGEQREIQISMTNLRTSVSGTTAYSSSGSVEWCVVTDGVPDCKWNGFTEVPTTIAVAPGVNLHLNADPMTIDPFYATLGSGVTGRTAAILEAPGVQLALAEVMVAPRP